MRKKILIVIAVIAVLAAAGILVYLKLFSDPNAAVRRQAVEITEDEPEKLSFSFGKKEEVKQLQPFYFVATEGSEYRFSVSDISAGSAAGIGLYVANEDFTDYMVLENYAAGEEDEAAEIKGDTYLEKGQKCYVMTVVVGDNNTEPFDGAVTVTVTRTPAEPEELKANDSLILEIENEGENLALFRPEESSYYKFDTTIITEDASEGFSSVSSIRSSDDRKIPMTEGLAWLEAGKDYHVWAEVSETGTRTSEVVLSCRKMQTLQAAGTCEIELEDDQDTVIEYTAEGNDYMAVYSLSEGDPAALIYEEPGFAIRSDDNSGILFSDNDKDFAMVFKPDKGRTYRIGIHRDIKSFKVVIEPYNAELTAEEASGD